MSKSICDSCKRDCVLRSPSSGPLPPIIHCDAFVSIPTNADRIRAMSDEGLADWLYMWAGAAPNCDRELSEHPDLKKCRDCWFDWLKKEAKK